MKDDSTNSPLPYSNIFSWKVGRMYFLSQGVKCTYACATICIQTTWNRCLAAFGCTQCMSWSYGKFWTFLPPLGDFSGNGIPIKPNPPPRGSWMSATSAHDVAKSWPLDFRWRRSHAHALNKYGECKNSGSWLFLGLLLQNRPYRWLQGREDVTTLQIHGKSHKPIRNNDTRRLLCEEHRASREANQTSNLGYGWPGEVSNCGFDLLSWGNGRSFAIRLDE